MTTIFRTAAATVRGLALVTCALVTVAACTGTPAVTSVPSAAAPSPSPSDSPSPSPSVTPSPSPSPTSESPSPTPTATTTSPPPPAQTVQDVAWKSARLPVMCGGAVEMVQLAKGSGKTKDGLVVEFLDVTFGSVTADPVDDIAVVQLDCVGAHPGPVDAPVFRSGAKGPEFVGFATMSLDRFDSARVSTKGVVVQGIGYSDKAPGCCPDLQASMVSTVGGNVLRLQERDTTPMKGAPKNPTECGVLQEVSAQLGQLAKQVPGHDINKLPPRKPVSLDALSPKTVAPAAIAFLQTLESLMQRGCP